MVVQHGLEMTHRPRPRCLSAATARQVLSTSARCCGVGGCSAGRLVLPAPSSRRSCSAPRIGDWRCAGVMPGTWRRPARRRRPPPAAWLALVVVLLRGHVHQQQQRVVGVAVDLLEHRLLQLHLGGRRNPAARRHANAAERTLQELDQSVGASSGGGVRQPGAGSSSDSGRAPWRRQQLSLRTSSCTLPAMARRSARHPWSST